MPKKFVGENSKSADAKARKNEAKNEVSIHDHSYNLWTFQQRVKVEKDKDDALWEDDDKHAMKKQQRKASLGDGLWFLGF